MVSVSTFVAGEVQGYPSYISYPKIWGISEGSVFRIEFTVTDAAALSNSTLLYTGQRGVGRRGDDFLALGLLNG